MKSKFNYIINKNIILMMFVILLGNCVEQSPKKFNHSATLFPLNGAHVVVACRECHKDGSLTAIPTDCQSCHPMTRAHTLNLGDCNLCHTTVTFAAPYFNHSRAGVSIQGAHIPLVVQNCQNCHESGKYTGTSFQCYRCHGNKMIIDGRVHTSTSADCQQCHTQASFTPAPFSEHNSYSTRLTGAHASLQCDDCHNSKFSNWQNINYRDNQTYGSCANCHTRNYRYGKDGHSGLPADANCGRCHGYSSFNH